MDTTTTIKRWKVNRRTREGRTVTLAEELARNLEAEKTRHHETVTERMFPLAEKVFRRAIGTRWMFTRGFGHWGYSEPLEHITLRRQVEYAVAMGLKPGDLRRQADDLAAAMILGLTEE